MIKYLLKRMTRKFESRYHYDATYLREITEVSTSASIRLMMISGITKFRGSEIPLWGGAALASTLHGDCGPCAQLVTDMLVENGIDSKQLRACLTEDWGCADSAGLGFRFAKAVLNNEPELSSLRAQILREFGKENLIAASYATSTYTIYPLLKRSLDYAQTCQTIQFADQKDFTLNSNK